jgi:hypothetical protein
MNKKITAKHMAKLWYSMLLFIVCNGNYPAQIIYTDITDVTPNASYSLDLNNDTVVDFILYYGGSSDTIGVFCHPQNNNAYSGNFLNNNYLAWALTGSNTICPSLTTWYDANNPGTLGWGSNVGYWVGATDKYLALKLIVGTNTYYGWARIDLLAASSSFTLKDYAYNSTPNSCLLTGQTILGNPEILNKSNLSIYPNPMHTSTTLKTIDPLNNATITIYNPYGQLVKQVTQVSGQLTTIYRDNLQSGLYFIHVTERNNTLIFQKLQITDD